MRLLVEQRDAANELAGRIEIGGQVQQNDIRLDLAQSNLECLVGGISLQLGNDLERARALVGSRELAGQLTVRHDRQSCQGWSSACHLINSISRLKVLPIRYRFLAGFPFTWKGSDEVTGARNSRGMTGKGFGSPACKGIVISGVTITTSSVLFRSTSLLLNRFPKIGRLDKPGMRDIVSVRRLSMRPPITKLWPSPSSILVSILRVERAGMVNPLNEIPCATSRVDTSGLTYMRMVLFSVIDGLKVSRTPNSRNMMVTAPELPP